LNYEEKIEFLNDSKQTTFHVIKVQSNNVRDLNHSGRNNYNVSETL